MAYSVQQKKFEKMKEGLFPRRKCSDEHQQQKDEMKQKLDFKRKAFKWAAVGCVLAGLSMSAAATTSHAADALPSWNDGPAKKSIVDFVAKVTKTSGPDFVPVAERIATFDNDGTLWAEQPMYFQAFFIFDRIKVLAPQHQEWKDKEPFASVLKGDVKTALAGGEHALLEMAMATHADMTTEAFEKIVKDWKTIFPQ
jgi:hypothetical protein